MKIRLNVVAQALCLCFVAIEADAGTKMLVTQRVVAAQMGAVIQEPLGSILACVDNGRPERVVGYEESFREVWGTDLGSHSYSDAGTERWYDPVQSGGAKYFEDTEFEWTVNYSYSTSVEYPFGAYTGTINEVVHRRWNVDGQESVCQITWQIVAVPLQIKRMYPTETMDVSVLPDINGDGYDDLSIGRKSSDSNKAGSGITIVDGVTGELLLDENTLGPIVRGGFDLDGDGIFDLVVGTPKDDDVANRLKDAGSITILYGPDFISRKTVYGVQAGALLGAALEVGDLDNDGSLEIIAGAPREDNMTQKLRDAGAVIIFDKDIKELTRHYGDAAGDVFGSSIALGEVNDDAFLDCVVGSPGADDVHGQLRDVGKVTVFSAMSDTPPIMLQHGTTQGAQLGASVAVGDINNDSFDDVLAGAPLDDDGLLRDAGSVSVFWGNGIEGSVKKYGLAAKADLGRSVAAGDVNGDGYDDIVAGAPKDDDVRAIKPLVDAGSVSVWSGNGYANIGSAPLYGKTSKQYFGAVVRAADMGDDGKDDLVIGVRGIGIGVSTMVSGATLTTGL